MEPKLLQISKQAIFPQKVQYPSHGFYVYLAWIFIVDKDVIQIYNDKDIEFFYQNFIDVALEACWGIG